MTCWECQTQIHTSSMIKACHIRAAADNRRPSEHGPEVLAELHAAGHKWAEVKNPAQEIFSVEP